jgi:predicted peptidase
MFATTRKPARLTLAALVGATVVASVLVEAQRRGGQATQGERRGGSESAAARRIQTRTYLFDRTSEMLEYAVFASTKVKNDRKSPLVIALHGAGVSPRQMLAFVADAAQDGGYIVFAPMGYTLQGWYGIGGRVAPGSPANLAELSEQDVMNVLDLARKEFNVDDRRIYLLGQSMGGAGALYLGVKHRQIWAAVGATAPAAGGLSPTSLEAAADVPMVLVHGDADEAVSVDQTRRWAAKMREMGMKYEYYEIRGGGHRDAIIAGAPRVFAFFDKHSK